MREEAILERNLGLALESLARHAPGGEVKRLAGVVIANAAVEVSLLNAALFSGPVEDPNDLERRIETAAVYYRLRGLPWSLWVCEHCLPRRLRRMLPDLLSRRGLDASTCCPGMAARLWDLPVAEEPPVLEVRKVQDEQTQLAFCRVVSQCFRIPFETAARLYRGAGPWDAQDGWVGYAEGAPVATAATLAAEGAVGLYSVATAPGYRRRGFAVEISRHALFEAGRRHGVGLAVLEATRQGQPVYRRLGFRPVTTIYTYFVR